MRTFVLAALVLVAVIGFSQANNTNRGLECSICESLVKEAYKEIDSYTGDAQKYGDELCKKVVGSNVIMNSICDSIVDDSIVAIIAGVEKNETPDVICKQIDMC
uniref:Saposin B-type domain-containing protein n=1 Tax=Panagrellus redivivus TaxID=6233 RepID=A0A7E4VPN7_PANRE